MVSRTGRRKAATFCNAKPPASRTTSVKPPKTHSKVVHGAIVSRAPDSTIASDGPSVVIAAMMPMLRPNFSRGETANVIFIPIGVSKPVPIACSKRAISSTPNEGASAPTMEPISISATTETNNGLVGKR